MTARKMPTKKAIKTHWAEFLVGIDKFDSVHEVMEDDYCFACGLLADTERSHILPKCRGGPDTIENLHLLCWSCHKQSEFISGDEYFAWLKAQNMIISMLYG